MFVEVVLASRELVFELVSYGKQQGILLNGSLLSREEVLPFLQEFARVYDINVCALRFLEHGQVEQAMQTLRLAIPPTIKVE